MNYDFGKTLVNRGKDFAMFLIWACVGSSISFFIFMYMSIRLKVGSMRKMCCLIFVFENQELKNEINRIKRQSLIIESVFTNGIYIRRYELEFQAETKKVDVKIKKNRRLVARQITGIDSLWFNMNRMIIYSFIMIVIIVAIQTLSYIWIENLNDKAYNLQMVYFLAIEQWNANFSFATFAALTVRYNNTIPAWGNMTTQDMVYYYDDHVKYKLVKNFTDLLDKNMDNYTDNYTTVFGTGNSCSDWLYASTPWCAEGYLNGYTEKNFIVLISGIRTSILDLISKWKSVRHDWTQTKALWSDWETLDLYGGFNKLMVKMYYLPMLPAYDSILGVSNSNSSILLRLTGISVIIVMVLMFILIVAIVQPLNELLNVYLGAIYLIPHTLVESNVELKHFLMRNYKKVKD